MKLVITEKPSVAQAVSAVIGADERKDGYMEGNGYIVSWCVGHLVELAQPESYCDAWKKWNYESLPMIPDKWQHEVKKETAAQYKVLKNLMHDDRIDTVIAATDAGREGELIFRLVYEMAGRQSGYGFLLWRKMPFVRALQICSREIIMITFIIPHYADRKRTGWWD